MSTVAIADRLEPPLAEWVMVTTDMATSLLENTAGNRVVSDMLVDRYARDMARGEWDRTGEAIKVNFDGQLVDGHHRLWACVQAGVPFFTVIVRGVPNDARLSMDTGRTRSFGDHLKIVGEVNYHSLSSAVNYIFRYAAWSGEGLGLPESGAQRSRHELDAALGVHTGLRDSTRVGTLVSPLLPKGMGAALHYLMAKQDIDLAAWFFEEGLHAGIGLGPDDAVRHLRERLIRDRDSKAKLPLKDRMAITIKAWNAQRTKSRTRALRWRSSGETPERFPVIR